ncbi:MAG: catalytic domain of component of various dehydrogenase complexe [Neobacillus sp.]|nr:catalytic domain of component of various dehydrogenase complexe [Neobacillus sp.]
MVTAIKMPKMGLSGDTSLIGQWIKKKGDKVSVGESILTVETDKATFEVEAEAEGVLLEVFYEEGDEVPVLTSIGVIGEEGEDFSKFLNEGSAGSEPIKDENEHQTDLIVQAQPTITANDQNLESADISSLKISPRAKRTAERLHLDYRFAEPSGASGRIIEKDILRLLEKAPRYTSAAKAAGILVDRNDKGTGLGGRVTVQDVSGTASTKPSEQKAVEEPATHDKPGYNVQPLSRMRKVIAKNMMNSLHNTAQLTLTSSFDAAAILAYRNKVKKQKESLGIENVTLNDMILFAVSRTLMNHKNLNAHLVDNDLLVFDSVHLGMAVDTPKGLIVPTLVDTNKKSLVELAKASNEMVEKCKDETILPHEMQGASFTVTNLGSFGIESFTPVLNPPQVGILGVNTIVYRVKQLEGKDITYPAMGLSLTFDHRALDGAPAARFLKDLTTNLEHFDLLLAK